MKKFKNTFGIRCKNPHIIAALVETAKDLGWGDQTNGVIFNKDSHVGMWFCSDSTTDQALKANHFWFCNSINTRSTKNTIYTLPAQWDEAIAAMSEVEEIKIGDWVVVLPIDTFYSNAEQGIAQQVSNIVTGSPLPYQLMFQNGKTNSYKEVRPATAEEIAAVKKTYGMKTVTLERSGREVRIGAGGVCGTGRSDYFNISEVKKLREMMDKEISIADNGWHVFIDSVTVGCTGGVTRADLNNIIDTYESWQA